MFETIVLLAQIMSLAGIAGWLTTGFWDNLRYPENNETYTAQVLSMARMQEDFPAEYARVAHRAVTSRSLQQLAFRLVVAAEFAATVILWLGIGALVLALFGAADQETARALGLLGAAMFTAIWAGFLVVGNYFSYWFCHEGAQNTHYQMTLWGMANMIFLAVAP